MVVGFTGTRAGMTPVQAAKLEYVLPGYSGLAHFHHGCCRGADAQFHWLVRKLFGDRCHIVGHRMKPGDQQDELVVQACDEIRDPLPPLVRNQNIVDAVKEAGHLGAMFATPSGFTELKRGSGTWATIRRARIAQVNLMVIYPDGSVGK